VVRTREGDCEMIDDETKRNIIKEIKKASSRLKEQSDKELADGNEFDSQKYRNIAIGFDWAIRIMEEYKKE